MTTKNFFIKSRLKEAHFNNDSASMAALLAGLLFSLTFSSMVIAFLISGMYGVSVTGNEAPIGLPNSGSIQVVQDYTTDTIQDNANFYQTGSDWVFVAGVGRVLSAATYSQIPYHLFLKGVSESNGVYTVYYKINNSVQQDYGVIIRDGDVTGEPGNIEVVVKDDGFHWVSSWNYGLTRGFAPLVNANQYKQVTIKTVYDSKKNTLDFYFNGVKQTTFEHLDIDYMNFFGFGQRYYAGVFSWTNGFTVEQINPTGLGSTSTSDILAQIGGFIALLGQIVLWNVNEAYLPLALNIIFIKTQLAAVVICAVFLVRGVG